MEVVVFKSIVNFFKNLIPGKKKPVVVTKPVETKPVETKPEVPTLPIGGGQTPTIPVETPVEIPSTPPTVEEPVVVKDTKNDGNPSKPDMLYLWDNMAIDKEAFKIAEIDAIVKVAVKNYARYKAVEILTSVPWTVIAVAHHKESSQDFAAALHNGDRIIGKGTKTTQVPKGRGPFKTWEEAAVDALLMKKGVFPSVWTPVERLLFLQRYNGLGHQNKGLEYTPYLWAYTNMHDETGNYIKDGVYSKTAVIKSAGCAPILLKLDEWEANQKKLGLI